MINSCHLNKYPNEWKSPYGKCSIHKSRHIFDIANKSVFNALTNEKKVVEVDKVSLLFHRTHFHVQTMLIECVCDH